MTALASTSNMSLYEQFYKLTEKIYYQEYSLSAEQRKIIENLSNQIEIVLSEPNDTTCGNKTDVFEQAYKWSYSMDGLNDSASEAEKFATLISGKLCPLAYFKIYKLSYEFAYATKGLDKTRNNAKNFASMISDYESDHFYIKQTLSCYIKNYQFAYSSDGMNKTRSEAEKFAKKQCLE